MQIRNMLGTEWEILSASIDTEEPEAAHMLSQAFNRKNEAAFPTGHFEIMRTLVSLCTPKPGTSEVAYDPLKAKMVTLFGGAAEHPSFVAAFQLVVTAGGSGGLSPKAFLSGPITLTVRIDVFSVRIHTSHLPNIYMGILTKFECS